MMKSKEVVAGDSENEFEVDEPEEVADHSDDEWAPNAAVAKTPGKRGRPAKSTPSRRKRAKNTDKDDDDDDEEEEILPKKERGSKPKTTPTKGRGRAAIYFSAMMKSKEVVAGDSENEFEVDEPEEVADHSDDEWVPNAAVAKTPGKRGRPAKSTPSRRKRAKNTDKDDDDDEEEEILPKKERGSKPKTTPTKGRGRAAIYFSAMMKSKEVVAGDSENEFEVDEPEEVADHSDDEWVPNAAVAKTPGKRGRPAKSTPSRRKRAKNTDKDDDDDEEEEILPKKERGSKPKTTPTKGRGRAAIYFSAMMKSKEVVAGDSENEFEVDEPEEVADHSDDEWAPNAAVAKTPGKRGRPAKSTPSSRKRAKNTDKDDDDDEEEEILPKKERGSKPKTTPTKGRGRAAIYFSAMMKSKEVVAGDSENEFEVDEPEEVADHSDDEWAPNAAVAKTPGKRGRPSKSTPSSRKRAKNTDNDDDDDEEEEILPKKERRSKPKTTPTKGRGRAAKGKAKKEVESEEDSEEEEEPEDEEEGEPEDEEELDEDEELEDEELDEEELNQGPNAKPAKKFTSGEFVVLKTDMLNNGNPAVWKIDGKALLQKYIPFEQDGKVLYKNTYVYNSWGPIVKYQYYSAPVSILQQTREEQIIEFYKDKIKKDPKVEEAAKKEMDEEEAELFAEEH